MRAFRKLLIRLDSQFFNSKIQNLYRNIRNSQILWDLQDDALRQINLTYKVPPENPLSLLCDKYGSDKGSNTMSSLYFKWVPLSYSDFYWQLWQESRANVEKVFECGIGTNNPRIISSMGANAQPGASLRVWRDFFPKAEIYGADIDADIIFQEHRIRTHVMDQTNPKSIRAYWEKFDIRDFDIMIDDGLHTFEAGVCLFENSIARLSVNGLYIIEDVKVEDCKKYLNYFSDSEYSFNLLVFTGPKDMRRGRLIIISKKENLSSFAWARS